jgi:hypothetical protein
VTARATLLVALAALACGGGDTSWEFTSNPSGEGGDEEPSQAAPPAIATARPLLDERGGLVGLEAVDAAWAGVVEPGEALVVGPPAVDAGVVDGDGEPVSLRREPFEGRAVLIAEGGWPAGESTLRVGPWSESFRVVEPIEPLLRVRLAVDVEPPDARR